MTRTRLAAALTAALALLFAGGVRADDKKDDPKKPDKLAQPPGDRPVGIPGSAGLPLLTPGELNKLDLSKEQKEKVEKLVKDYEAKQKEITEKMGELRSKPPTDPVAFRDKMREFFQATQKARTEADGKIKEILNDEQKKKFEEIQKSRPRFPGPGGPFGPGGLGGPPFGPGGGGPFAMMGVGKVLPPFLAERMNLTKEQKADLEKLQKEVDEKLGKILNADQKKMLEQLKSGRPPLTPIPPRPGGDRE
jgi:Spy/CpxP family protein refolding chaperone